MKIKKSILFLFVALTTQMFAKNIGLDILSYDFKIDMNVKEQSLNVQLQMTIAKTKNHDVKMIFTHFASINSLFIKGKGTKTNVHIRCFSKDSIQLILPENINLSQNLTILFYYHLPLDSINGTKTSGMYSLTRPQKWYPLQYNDLSKHKIQISVPNQYITLSTGDIINVKKEGSIMKYSWEDLYNFTCPLFIFLKDSVKTLERTVMDKKILFYYRTKDTILQREFSNIVCASFKYFYLLFQKEYPYKRYSFLEIPDNPAASAVGSLQVFGNSLLSDYYTYGKLYSLKPAAHEVAHEWWGIGRIHFKDKTTEKGLQFLRESMDEYLTYMFIENYWNNDSLQKCIKISRLYYKSYVNNSSEKCLFDIPHQFNSWEEAVIIYYKGPLIVQKLRESLGNQKWISFLRKFYSTYKDKFATYSDFEAILSLYDNDGSIRASLTKLLTTKGPVEN